ncbi:hypothetical protein A1O1_00874 [Capronia coronata CBS 617.96]|uniref:Uncharacterized protein n=1 Tax=Capronia coronata CBS 617.96 TaxID=1182541 RepID=W9Z1B0_9EURO|nr:uncharacterized protein A1O1_00874 [Capronia coronata CBS 617.96]EXJ95750.1 hypothetical protein A1O1_00874 [Capronia coronata CBS 617.96]
MALRSGQTTSLAPESSVMAVHKAKRPRPPSRHSSDRLSIEELSPDDMGYDGDVEVLHPDQYEEPESEFERDSGNGNALLKVKVKVWPDTDDELAGRLRRLSCEPHGPRSPGRDDSDRGRKRRSKEMDVDSDHHSPLGKRTVIEVSELVDAKTNQPPLKRRRKRIIINKASIGHRLMKRQVQVLGAWSDSSDKTDDLDGGILSSNPGTPEAVPTLAPEQGEGFDAMDMG